MKTQLKLAILIMFSFALMSSTCSSDDDGGSSNNQNTGEIVNVAQSGTWRITSFVDSGNDETNHFTGYNFTFGDNSVLTATNGNNTLTGTWSVTNSSSSSSSSGPDFNIFFPVPDSSPFEDLNDDWDIVNTNSNTISLIDVSGGNGGTDTLVFQKN